MSVTINGNTGISGVNGSASNPAIKGTDADSGIHFGADTASITTGGTERVSIDSSGTATFSNDVNIAGTFKVAGVEMVSAAALPNDSLVINGEMLVSQRGTSVANTIDGQYLVDRFKVYDAGTNNHTLTQSQSSNAPGGNTSFTKSLRVEVTSGATTPTSGYTVISQKIEGLNSAHLNFGSAFAKTVTVSFWAKTNVSGNYALVLRNQALNRAYIKQFASMGSDAWFYYQLTIPGDTAGTWITNNGSGLEVMWTLDAGSTWHATNDAWNAQNVFGLAANDNDWSDTTGNYFELTGVKVEVGSTATPFAHESISQTLAKCQRYFEGTSVGTSFLQGDSILWSGYSVTGQVLYAAKSFLVEKRAVPTVAFSGGTVNGFTYSTAQVLLPGTRGLLGSATASSTNAGGFFMLHYTADAEL